MYAGEVGGLDNLVDMCYSAMSVKRARNKWSPEIAGRLGRRYLLLVPVQIHPAVPELHGEDLGGIYN